MKKIVRYTLMAFAIIIVLPMITAGWLIIGFPCALGEWAFDDNLGFWNTMKRWYGGCLREFGFHFSWNPESQKYE